MKVLVTSLREAIKCKENKEKKEKKEKNKVAHLSEMTKVIIFLADNCKLF